VHVIRTVVVDDDDDMRRVAAMTLSVDPRIHVVGVASDGPEAIALWRKLRPDAVVLDLRMPGMSGLEVARLILAEDHSVSIALCSATTQGQEVRDAMALGVTVIVDKLDLDGLADILASTQDPRRSA
jgi:CheY-like chemotaxis protein